MTKICSSNLLFTGGQEKGSQFVVPRKYFALGMDGIFKSFHELGSSSSRPFFSWAGYGKTPHSALGQSNSSTFCLFFEAVTDHTVAACSSASSCFLHNLSVSLLSTQGKTIQRGVGFLLPCNWKAQRAIGGERADMAPPNRWQRGMLK